MAYLKKILTAALLCALLCQAAPCLAADSSSASGKLKEQPAPIVITARTMFADNKKRTVIYKGDVVVKKADVTMYASEVIIRMLPAGRKQEASGSSGMFEGSGRIDTIEARGGVRILQEDKTATSDEAMYYSATDSIVMTGRPRVWQGDNVLTGTKITYDVKGDTFTADDANTVLYQADGKPSGKAGATGSQ